MNILFFLKPKSEVAYVEDKDKLRQVLEKLERHRYSAIPLINSHTGKYIGTITEGDLLWSVKERYDLSIKEAEDIPITAIKRHRDNEPVDIDENMENLLNKVMLQNFVPVTDDKKCFIGIITRKDVMSYLLEDRKKGV